MVKHCLILLGFLLFTFPYTQSVKAETVSKTKDLYVTTEDIVSDLVFPAIDKRARGRYPF